MRWLPLLALIVSPLASAVTLDELQQRFTGQPVVRAHFEQVRTIKDMPQPLRSQGEMLIARDSGLLWDQKAPFPMTLLLDDKRMVQAINGRRPSPPTIIRRCSSSTIFCGPCSRLTAGCLKRTSASILKTWARAAGRWCLRQKRRRWTRFSPPSIWAARPIWRRFASTTNRATVPISPFHATN